MRVKASTNGDENALINDLLFGQRGDLGLGQAQNSVQDVEVVLAEIRRMAEIQIRSITQFGRHSRQNALA